jgi:hypothetical protein
LASIRCWGVWRGFSYYIVFSHIIIGTYTFINERRYIMIELIYKRLETGVVDIRYFKDEDELKEWMERQNKLEKIGILKKSVIEKVGA